MVETVCKLLWSERFFSSRFEGALWLAKAIAGLMKSSSLPCVPKNDHIHGCFNAKLPKLLLVKM